jgi:hypothetical protein
MRNPHGYATWTDPERVVERDSFSCRHCNRIVFVEPKADPAEVGGLCKQCMGLICPQCVGLMRCLPLEKSIAESEERDRRRRDLARLGI